LKVRIKFKKTGIMKFIGHLDVMRYFQKVNRRAGVDIAYSAGFSPHQLMSFASPLGLGLTSEGEYLDMEVNSCGSSRAMAERMNGVMGEGMEILSFLKLPDHAKTAMSLVAAADYILTPREVMWPGWKEEVDHFLAQEVILVQKKTKKSEKEVNIRPLIYEGRFEGEGLFVRLASGSADNLKPELFLEAFFQYAGQVYEPCSFAIHRLELYAREGGKEEGPLVPLAAFGEEIL
jgi:radical SAM-linked protein